MTRILTALVAAVLCVAPAEGAQIFVPSGGSIRDAVALARPGDEIVLEAGGVYTETVRLPDKGAGAPITIRSSATLPDRRIGPADRALLPSIGSGEATSPIVISGSRWRLVGLAFRSNAYGQGTIIDVRGAAADIAIDRVLIEGGPHGQKRGVTMNGGGAITVTRSHMANLWKSGEDSQAVAAWDGPGPFTIRDNYLEAASENVLFGGADSSSEARMPADILVEGNHLTKQVAWRGVRGRVIKNLFQLKAGRRAIIRNNLMEHNWEDGQAGWAIVVTPRNQGGKAPWTAIEDVLFEGNVVRGTTRGINITGRDDLGRSAQTRRVTLRNNLFITDAEWLQAVNEIGELTLDHNTVVNGSTLIKLAYGSINEGTYSRPSQYAVGQLTILNSLMLHGARGYGIWGEASGLGTVALAHHTLGYDVRRNVIAGENGWIAAYPPGTLQPGYAAHADHFIAALYALEAGSSYRRAALDGGDLGAVLNVSILPPPTAPPAPPTPPAPATLPQPWTSQDIGEVSFAGGASVADGVFRLSAAGADVWGTADGLHYAWQRVSGDIDVVARVASIEHVHAWTKAGVMIRETLTTDSPHAFMLASPGKGLAFQRRVAHGGISTSTTGGTGTAPTWVKLERRGAVITAYRSNDGVNWTVVGSDTFAISADIYVGLALSSHDEWRLANATFDHVTVRAASPPAVPARVAVSITPVATLIAELWGSFSRSFEARGGTGSYRWRIDSGTLPPGLALDASTGVLSGAPQHAGTFSFVLQVSDASDAANAATLGLTLAVTADWNAQNIGAVAVPGTFSELGGTLTVRGAGRDIGGTADELQYAWQRVSGDVDIVARVASIEKVNALTKAGVMIRQSLAAGSPNASMLSTKSRGLSFQRRLTTDGATASSYGGGYGAPVWVKLERRGDTIRAFRSTDGAAWTLVGSEQLALGSDVYVGLAVSSHDEGRAATAAFTGVVIRRLQ